MSKKSRVKKLTLADREEIRKLAQTGLISYSKIAKIYDISRGRVSQIVNDNYQEKGLEGNE